MKDIHDQTFYELLEVDPTATQEEILKAYNRARATYGHNSPALYSLFNKEEAQELLRLIDEAYAVLSNQFKRRQYDSKAQVSPHQEQGFFHDPHDKNQKITSSIADGESNFAIPSAATLPGYNETLKFQDEPIKESKIPEAEPPPRMRKQEAPAITSQKSVIQNPPAQLTKVQSSGATSFGNYKIDPLFEDEIKRTEIFSGPVIQKIRLYKNITIDQISETTKISRSYLIAVETENFTSLPAPVFVRGFIVQIAKILGLDSTKAANSFVNLLKESQKK